MQPKSEKYGKNQDKYYFGEWTRFSETSCRNKEREQFLKRIEVEKKNDFVASFYEYRGITAIRMTCERGSKLESKNSNGRDER